LCQRGAGGRTGGCQVTGGHERRARGVRRRHPLFTT
jgi:hypothetical protein